MAYSACLPARLNPLAERTCFPQVLKHQQDEEKERVAAGTVSRGGERREAEEARREAETARRESRHR